jgi:two-component system alkaline phosphatase synthesis response regulator PhoP
MPYRILVVDDEAHIVHVLSLKLRNAGYEVLTAVDGEEAYDVAIRERPDLVITDFSMPYLTGVELCQALLKEASTAAIPVVLLTARGYALDEEALAVGNIRGVLSKPFSPRSVLTQVRALLSGADGEVTDATDAPDETETEPIGATPPATSAAPDRRPAPAGALRTEAAEA